MRLTYKLCPGYVHLDYLVKDATYKCKPIKIGQYSEVLYYIDKGKYIWDRTGGLSHRKRPDHGSWGVSPINKPGWPLNTKHRIFELVD
jgi:hypothetical protein